MVARSRIGTAALAFVVTSIVVACGSIIGIEDGILDPALSGAEGGGGGDLDSSTIDSSSATDSSMPIDSSPPKDAALPRGPLGGQGGGIGDMPCGGQTCAIPGQTCCAYRKTGTTMFIAGCDATCPPLLEGTDRTAALKCSRASNCQVNERCCYTLPATNSVQSSCKSSCQQNDQILCDPDNTGQQCPFNFSCIRFAGNSLPSSWGHCMYTG
jgi:hypothetical protein